MLVGDRNGGSSRRPGDPSRARGACSSESGERLGPDVRITEPFGYRSSLALQLHAAAVLTDSGGVQREAGWLGTPCLVLRSTTEWVEPEA